MTHGCFTKNYMYVLFWVFFILMCYLSSYLHCKWATLKELEKDPRIHQKIKRFRTKQKPLFTEVTYPTVYVFFILSSSHALYDDKGTSPRYHIQKTVTSKPSFIAETYTHTRTHTLFHILLCYSPKCKYIFECFYVIGGTVA